MKYFGEFLKFSIPYSWRIGVSVIFNFLSTIFNLLLVGMVIPFLSIIFNQQEIIYERVPLALSKDAIINNFNFLLSKIIVDQGAHQALLVVSMFVVVAILLKSIFIYSGNYVIVPLRNGMLKDIRDAMYKKIIYLPMRFFSDERKGDLISRMIGDVKELEGSVVNSLQKALISPIELIVYLTTLFMMSAHLTVFVLLLLPLSSVFIGRLAKSLRRKATKGQQRLGNLLINMEETLSGIRIIKAFTAEEKVKNRFFKENSDYTTIMNKVMWKKFLAHPISEFMGTMVIVVIMWYGGGMVLNNGGELSPAEFITFIVIFFQIISPAKSLADLYFDISKGMGAYERVREVLIADESIKDAPGAEKIGSFENKIQYEDVTFSYNKTEVLKNINLTIEKGQTVALVGQSGAGKSTLVDLLPRFYDIMHGRILLDGLPLKQINIESLRKQIGVVSQEQILFNDTIFNNIAFGVESATMEEVIHAAKVANAHEFILETDDGYDTIIGDRGGKLSGGQRQRLTIARAVLVNPPILILDEATSALDAESEKLVQDALERLMQNRTSIVIAHRLSTVKNADIVCVMKNGEIIESGKHDELLEKGGAFKELYEQQMS